MTLSRKRSTTKAVKARNSEVAEEEAAVAAPSTDETKTLRGGLIAEVIMTVETAVIIEMTAMIETIKTTGHKSLSKGYGYVNSVSKYLV